MGCLVALSVSLESVEVKGVSEHVYLSYVVPNKQGMDLTFMPSFNDRVVEILSVSRGSFFKVVA